MIITESPESLSPKKELERWPDNRSGLRLAPRIPGNRNTPERLICRPEFTLHEDSYVSILSNHREEIACPDRV
jgi:hypothetical protein